MTFGHCSFRLPTIDWALVVANGERSLCMSMHASQLAGELVRVDLSVTPGQRLDPHAGDRLGSRRALWASVSLHAAPDVDPPFFRVSVSCVFYDPKK